MGGIESPVDGMLVTVELPELGVESVAAGPPDPSPQDAVKRASARAAIAQRHAAESLESAITEMVKEARRTAPRRRMEREIYGSG